MASLPFEGASNNRSSRPLRPSASGAALLNRSPHRGSDQPVRGVVGRCRVWRRMASMDATEFIVILIVFLATTVVAAPLASEAQPAGKIARIGLLCATRCEGPGLDVLRAGLRDLGWVEGRNLVIEARAAGGQLDRLPALARELIALNPDIIVAPSPQPSRAAKDATSVLPVVFVGVADPVRV